jgi:hypothetical protein
MEHYVTLFDSHYLPQGLCLYQSLERHGQPFHLWVVAMDQDCVLALQRIGLGHATIVGLHEVENDALRSVKSGRSMGEYCWTLTPFLPTFVFHRAPQVKRITYLDADLYFFRSPCVLFDELAQSRKHVLITEHAFAPEYRSHIQFGRFCVQFVTFRNTEAARSVLDWWQERCIEWCYAREVEGKFGDQKYLDQWPDRFPDAVHILSRTDMTAAPWNVLHLDKLHGKAEPVFFHFHGLKVVSDKVLVLYYMYEIGRRNRWIYREYVRSIRTAVRSMRRLGISVVARPLLGGDVSVASFLRTALRGNADWALI